MAKKILFVFAGTGVDAKEISAFSEKEGFNDDVIRVYFNGCQDESIGGRWKLKGYVSPDLDMVAKKIRESFSKAEGGATLNLAELQRLFSKSIIIVPKEGLNAIEEVDDITLNGFSRGAVTTFATARALDDLDTPISILAEDPVPGNSRTSADEAESLYSKNADLSGCKNIVRSEVLLGTYSKYNYFWENKWFRQMAPKFPPSADSHLFLLNKESHCEFNRRGTTYSSSFLHHRGLTKSHLIWAPDKDRAFVIPKVEQQKFHHGVMGRVEYLPSFKQALLTKLREKYTPPDTCPVEKDSKFKFVQALSALHNASIAPKTFDALSIAVLNDTDKGKGLREFIIELNGIIQYSKEKDTLTEFHLSKIAAFEQKIYQKIADFQKMENPTRKHQEAFVHAIQAAVKLEEASLPCKVYNKLETLMTELLNENTLVHPHLVQFMDESETCVANALAASRPALDGIVTNAHELAQKLFHSSATHRTHVFDEEKSALPKLLTNTTDLAAIAPFLPPKQLAETLELVNDRVKSMADLLTVMKVLPTYEQRKKLYHANKDKIIAMKPNFVELVDLMTQLSDTKCKELCQNVAIATLPDFDMTDATVSQLTASKMKLLQDELAATPVDKVKTKTESPTGSSIDFTSREDLTNFDIYNPIVPKY